MQIGLGMLAVGGVMLVLGSRLRQSILGALLTIFGGAGTAVGLIIVAALLPQYL